MARPFQCCAKCEAGASGCPRTCFCHARRAGFTSTVTFPVIGEQYPAAERFNRGDRVESDGHTFEGGELLFTYSDGEVRRNRCEVQPIGDRSWLVIVEGEGEPAR